MAPNIVKSLVLFSSLALTAQAAVDTQLTGTWSSKSRKVITGPVCVIVPPSRSCPREGNNPNADSSYGTLGILRSNFRPAQGT